MNEFLVECPKCKKAAVVQIDETHVPHTGKLTCMNCFHAETTEDLIRYNAIVKRSCDHCGKPIHITIPNQKLKSEQISVPCPHCGTTRVYQPRNEEYRIVYKSSDSPSDTMFNLPLWLQIEVKDNLFWAYNKKHLQDIKRYVQAKLRERQTLEFTTMVERLPKFIKEAKNRDAILKAIERLERK
jgi:endogenous inhibitor of DNA gyrase (YacG/DUF329 family)